VYKSFTEFYENFVIPIKHKYLNWIQLNGPTNIRSPRIAAKFIHYNKTYEIHEDTWIDRLDIAYTSIKKGNNPFKQELTRKGRMCLVLVNGIRPPGHKYLYIFLVK